MDGESLGKKSYFDQVMAWGRRDDARRARERAAQERRERRQQERDEQRARRVGNFAAQHTPPPVEEVKAVYNPNTGVTSNYFGGYDRIEGDGPWHGHYDVDEEGNVLFGRDPGERR